MISGYEVSGSSGAAATTKSYGTLWFPASSFGSVREVGIFNSSASTVADITQLFRATTRGVSPASTVTPTAAANAQNTGMRAPSALLDLGNFGTTPVDAAVAMKMIAIAGTVGSGIIWTWPADGELQFLAGTGLDVFNGSGSTGPILRLYFVWSE